MDESWGLLEAVLRMARTDLEWNGRNALDDLLQYSFTNSITDFGVA